MIMTYSPSLVTDSGAEDLSDCCCVLLAPIAVATRNQDPAVESSVFSMVIILMRFLVLSSISFTTGLIIYFENMIESAGVSLSLSLSPILTI